MANRILQKIIALRERSSNAAATEAEVNSCLAQIQRLMEEYSISVAEIARAEAMPEVRIVVKDSESLKVGGSGAHWQASRICAGSIAQLTKTEYIFMPRSGGRGVVEFTGEEVAVDTAVWLMNLVKNAVWNDFASWAKAQKEAGELLGFDAKKSHQSAESHRILERIDAMVEEQRARESHDVEEEAQSQGISAAEVRERSKVDNLPALTSTTMIRLAIDDHIHAEAERLYRENHPRIRYSSWGSRRNYNSEARAAGRAAGDRLNLGRPDAVPPSRRIR